MCVCVCANARDSPINPNEKRHFFVSWIKHDNFICHRYSRAELFSIFQIRSTRIHRVFMFKHKTSTYMALDVAHKMTSKKFKCLPSGKWKYCVRLCIWLHFLSFGHSACITKAHPIWNKQSQPFAHIFHAKENTTTIACTWGGTCNFLAMSSLCIHQIAVIKIKHTHTHVNGREKNSGQHHHFFYYECTNRSNY